MNTFILPVVRNLCKNPMKLRFCPQQVTTSTGQKQRLHMAKATLSHCLNNAFTLQKKVDEKANQIELLDNLIWIAEQDAALAM